MIEPRFAWHPPRVRSLGADCVALWDSSAPKNKRSLEWQRFVVDGMLGLDADEKFVSPDDGLNVARQNGKGVILQMIELFFAFEVGYDLVMHTAHEVPTALDHQMRLEQVIQDCPELHKQVKDRGGYMHANGRESINLKSGSRILFKARTSGSGRGYSGDLLIWDEAMIIPDRVFSAQKFTTRASQARYGQKTIYAGSAVDRQVHEHGVNFTRMRLRGSENDPRVSYFEWSAPFDHPDDITRETLADLSYARAANPSMDDGLITEETVMDEVQSSPLRSLAVEIYGIGDYPPVDASSTGLFDIAKWISLAADGDLEGAMLSIDVSPLRTWATIGGAKKIDKKVRVGVVDRQEGTGWIVSRCLELRDEIRPAGFVLDVRGPASSLIPELEAAGIAVIQIDTAEYTRACGMFFDAYEQETIEHDGHPALEAAVRGAAQRTLADAWAWSRKHSKADITPLVAASLTLWGASTAAKPQFVGVAFA